MVLPPSIPNLPQFAVMCGILDQGGAWCILQPIVLKKCFGLFSLFSLQAVMCLLQVLILNIFAVGLSFFLIMEICMFVAILDPFSHSVFAMDFFLWLSFGCFYCRAPPSQLKSMTQPRGSGFFHRLRIIWFGLVKLLR